jgi:hypothetical protein
MNEITNKNKKILLIIISIIIFTLSICMKNDVGIIIILGYFIIILFYLIIKKLTFDRKQENKYKSGNMTDEEKNQYQLYLHNKEIEKENKIKRINEINNNLMLNKEIDYVIIAGNNSHKSATSSAIRGTLGFELGSLVNPAGAVIGAAAGLSSGRNKENVTFKIVYKSGRVAVKSVKYGSSEYKNLCKYL